MNKLSKFFPTAKIANILMLLLCLWECFSFYQTGFDRGYLLALEYTQKQAQTQTTTVGSKQDEPVKQ